MRPRTIAVHAIAWAAALVWVVPFLGVLMASLRPPQEITFGWWNFSSFHPSLDSFAKAMTNPSFPISRGMVNSLIVAIPGTIIPLSVATLAGYGFARFSFPVRDYLFLAIVLFMSIPQQMIAIPIFQIMVNLNLVDSFLGVILLHAAWGLPWIILFMRNFFTALPLQVEEAARVDGASDFKVFYKIVLPMALPALASAAILQFMWVWNDFFFALILIGKSDNYLATQMIPKMTIGQYTFDWGLLSAASILVMLIPFLLYAFTQKYYIRGMIGWTVKG